MPESDQFTMPMALVVDQATATDTYAKFVSEPWEKGFGQTLGNALRRVLLSSMEGVAVSSIRIDGVPHEFTTIDHVIEDVTEIVLNMKHVRFLCDGDTPRMLELFAEKAGTVTAGDIHEDGVTTVINKDAVICTLDKDTKLHMEIEVDRGRGYRPSEDNKREDQPIGVIPVDCLFSPIERVRYDVQACRVGQRTDYDRLELEVWTDGRITPHEAVQKAAGLLREHLAVFVDSEDQSTPAAPQLTAEDREMVDKLSMGTGDLELSVRAKNCLNNAQVRNLGQLVEKTEGELLKYRNFGKKSLEEIKSKLVALELSLGMTLKDEIRAALDEQDADQQED